MCRKLVIIYSPNDTAGALIEAMIAGFGAEIIRIGSVEELLGVIRLGIPRLIIILDIAPLINGLDIATLLRKITTKALHSTSHIRSAIYVITWQQDEQSVLSLLESGIDQYLTFPICIDRLRNKVCEQILGRRDNYGND